MKEEHLREIVEDVWPGTTWPEDEPEADSRSSALLCHPVAYKLPWTRYERSEPWMRMEVVATKFDDGGLTPTAWAVREGGAVLSKDGDWEFEPIPSSRDDEFISRTRWDTAEEAANAASNWHNAQKYDG